MWLENKRLGDKTINKHLNNIYFFLNTYLIYYDVIKMEDGIYHIDSFLGDWFIRKCMWSSKNSIKENASSIKKFYKCMVEYHYISKEDYDEVCNIIKDNIDNWLMYMDKFNNHIYFDL